MIARISPEPRPMPSRGKSQLAMNAPTMPMAISPIRPMPVPRTILQRSEARRDTRARRHARAEPLVSP